MGRKYALAPRRKPHITKWRKDSVHHKEADAKRRVATLRQTGNKAYYYKNRTGYFTVMTFT